MAKEDVIETDGVVKKYCRPQCIGLSWKMVMKFFVIFWKMRKHFIELLLAIK